MSESSPDIITRSDDIELRLSATWQNLLGVESVGLSDNYFDLGGDSILAVHLFAEIEKSFKIRLPVATLYDAPTIEELARIIRGEVTTSGWSPLVEIQSSRSRPPFFCVHPHGGNVLIYRDLARHLGPDQPFYGLQCQGLDGNQPPLTRIEEMAALYVREIRKVQAQGPYLLGGYCMGGTVAFEMARQLHGEGERVALLALFDTTNWSEAEPASVWQKGFYNAERFIFHATNFISLKGDAKWTFLREKLRSVRGRMPVWRAMVLSKFGTAGHDPASRAHVLAQVWRCNEQACCKYVPKLYPGAVTDFRPKRQYTILNSPELNWDRLAQGGREIIVLPVNPPGMLVEPFVEHLAVALRRSIDKVLHSPPFLRFAREGLETCRNKL